jgi:sec-independent protein translocase protein TatA
MLNGWEILLVVALVVVFFGAKRLPNLARSLGNSIKEFKVAVKDNPRNTPVEQVPTHKS